MFFELKGCFSRMTIDCERGVVHEELRFILHWLDKSEVNDQERGKIM